MGSCFSISRAKEAPTTENTIVVKIYNPYPNLGGKLKFANVQERIDKVIGIHNVDLVLFGQNSGTKYNPYIQYAPNSDGPTPIKELQETCLIEYYTELPAKDALGKVELIHQVLCEELQEKFKIQYMIIGGVDMHSLDKNINTSMLMPTAESL